MIYVVGPKDRSFTKDKEVIITCSISKNWSKGLSPFILGPCPLYDGHVAKNVENGYQSSKLYDCHADDNGDPTEEYWKWAKQNWDNPRAKRYPMGKGAKPMCSLWEGEKLSYVEARNKIYIPLYEKAVRKTAAFEKLEMYHELDDDIYLWDFDGYNHRANNMSWEDVVHNDSRPMGHAFVLAMMLEGYDKYLTGE